MKNKATLTILILTVILATILPAIAAIEANPHIDSAGISLNSSMRARFDCSASDYYDISVYSVTLYKRNANGTWSYAGSLPAPPSAQNTSSYTKSVNYATYCTHGNTYRISAIFDASGETVSRTSNAMPY